MISQQAFLFFWLLYHYALGSQWHQALPCMQVFYQE